jgi:hypothetical protein
MSDFVFAFIAKQFIGQVAAGKLRMGADSFFGRLWFAFGLHTSIPPSLLGKMNAERPVKGVFAGRLDPKSTVLNLNQLLIYGSLVLI